MSRSIGQPRFAFVNLMELHDPYDPPTRYHPLLGSCGRPRPGPIALLNRQARQKRWRSRADSSYLTAIRALYHAAARYEDELVGRFLEVIRGGGRPTVVIVVSDHGENLGEHGLFEHHSSLHETLLHVPLLVSAFGRELDGGVVDDPVSLLGLADWIEGTAEDATPNLAVADAQIAEYEGTVRRPQVVRREIQPLLEAGKSEMVPALYFQPGMAVRTGDAKYLVTEDGHETVFDLRRDAGESSGRAPSVDDALPEFRAHRDAWLERRRGAPPPDQDEGQQQLDEEIADHLRALGYLE
jgi:arylsulfatase A-like enzyme